MNLKKILAVVLSMTLLVSCLVSGMSLNTSAATPDQETAKTQLTDAWGKMSKTPEVVFENFVEKDGNSWSDKTTNSTYDSNIGANVYNATADKGLIVVTGAYNYPTKWANFNNYDEIYFYYSSPNSDGTFAPDTCTESSEYASGTLGGPTVTLTKTTDSNLVKFDLMTATKNASGYDSANYYATGAEKRAMFRLRFGTVPTNFKISQVFGVKKTVVPDTADKTLGEVIKLADAEDLTQYEDNDAKTAFQTALADAKKVMLRNPDDAIAYITEAWKKVENKSEVVFSSFYDKRTGSWSENASVTDVVIQGDAVKVFNPTNNNLIIMAPGATDVNQPTESINIELYDEIYLYYKSTDKSYSNVQYPSYKTDGTVAGKYSTTLSQTTGDEYYKFDIKNDIISRPDYGSNKDYYNGTTGKWFRLHFGNNDVTTALSISQVYGVKPLELAAAFSDVFDAEGNAKNLTLAQLIDAYTKYDIEKNYDAAELIAAVNDVCAANPKYAAFKTVAGYANKVQKVNKVSGQNGAGGGATIEKVESLPEGMPGFTGFETPDTYKVNFTGKGTGVLGTTGHRAQFIKFDNYTDGFSASYDTYLGYYIPSTVTAEIKIQLHYRGATNNGDTANTNAAYLKTVTLDNRDEWVILDSADLKPDAYSNLTGISNNIVVDLIAPSDTSVEMYFSPFAFTNSANYINTAGATTLTDYAEKYNATAFTEGERYLYEADFIAARTAFNEALNSEFKISGDAIWSKGNECFYDKGDSTLATAYRTFAQYTCPIEKGQPVLDKVVVDGQSYNLVSRSILIARSADGTFGTLDMSTVGDKYVKTTGENLSAKYWSVADNGDGTATVTYSMLLKGVSKENAESKYHMTRAMIEYTDGAGNTVQVYSKPREHGTIKDTFNYAHGNNNNLQWFPQVNN